MVEIFLKAISYCLHLTHQEPLETEGKPGGGNPAERQTQGPTAPLGQEGGVAPCHRGFPLVCEAACSPQPRACHIS